MKIITNVSASADFSGVSYGLIEISTEFAATILSWMDKAKELNETITSFNNIEIFNYSVDYFNYFDSFGEIKNAEGSYLEELLDEQKIVILPDELEDSIEPPDEACVRTDCDTIHVSQGEIHWEAYSKHTDVQLHTNNISREWIEKIANGGRP
jgi:hypothetical protein